MQSLRHESEPREARSDGDERRTGELRVAAAACELTARELELQRRLVRESLLLRAT